MIVLLVLAVLAIGTLGYSLIGLALDRKNVDFQLTYPTPYKERYAETRKNNKT